MEYHVALIPTSTFYTYINLHTIYTVQRIIHNISHLKCMYMPIMWYQPQIATKTTINDSLSVILFPKVLYVILVPLYTV